MAEVTIYFRGTESEIYWEGDDDAVLDIVNDLRDAINYANSHAVYSLYSIQGRLHMMKEGLTSLKIFDPRDVFSIVVVGLKESEELK